MNTLIVYNHPYKGSFCHALLESVIKGAKEKGNTVDIINLDEDAFNPVMTPTDLKNFVQHQMTNKNDLAYLRKLENTDHLIFIFPIWWELMPALTKGFIDKIMFPGHVYDYVGKQKMSMAPRLTKLKKISILTTMNTPKIIYKILYGNAIKRTMVNGIFKKMGYKNVSLHSFHMVKTSSIKKRQNWLHQAYTTGAY